MSRPLVQLAVCVCVALPATARAQQTVCDASLAAPANDPLRYRLRGDRCEGIYAQEVGSTTLWIASLTAVFEDYDLAGGAPLRVAWAPIAGDAVSLRASSLERRRYYRMDATLPARSASYLWPTAILSGLPISRPNLGVVGWTRMSVGGKTERVYLPLQISQQKKVGPSTRYEVVLVPGRELSEVYVSLAPVQADGRLGAFIRSGQALGNGYYPAERGIAIPLPRPPTPGVYYLEIGADLAGGGVATTQLLFHSGG